MLVVVGIGYLCRSLLCGVCCCVLFGVVLMFCVCVHVLACETFTEAVPSADESVTDAAGSVTFSPATFVPVHLTPRLSQDSGRTCLGVVLLSDTAAARLVSSGEGFWETRHCLGGFPSFQGFHDAVASVCASSHALRSDRRYRTCLPTRMNLGPVFLWRQ